MSKRAAGTALDEQFVLEKSIFSNVFGKDIRRVYIYKKVERLAKAIHMVAPAFRSSPMLAERVDLIAVALIDAGVEQVGVARDALARELLALSSILSIARSTNILSPMNADLIAREAHALLQELAAYEEPRLSLEEAPSLAELQRDAGTRERSRPDQGSVSRPVSKAPRSDTASQGHISDTRTTNRREAILAVLTAKGPSYIKDISTVIRDVSEKTIQRELSSLVTEGVVSRAGERRWTTYTLAA